MLIDVMHAKIHRVAVTDAHLHYVGSIGIDQALIDAAGLVEGQRVQIVNINNGERIETYIIREERNSGRISLNGPAARRVQVGDIVIIIAYAQCTPEEAHQLKPTVIFPNEHNRLVSS